MGVGSSVQLPAGNPAAAVRNASAWRSSNTPACRHTPGAGAGGGGAAAGWASAGRRVGNGVMGGVSGAFAGGGAALAGGTTDGAGASHSQQAAARADAPPEVTTEGQ